MSTNLSRLLLASFPRRHGPHPACALTPCWAITLFMWPRLPLPILVAVPCECCCRPARAGMACRGALCRCPCCTQAMTLAPKTTPLTATTLAPPCLDPLLIPPGLCLSVPAGPCVDSSLVRVPCLADLRCQHPPHPRDPHPTLCRGARPPAPPQHTVHP